MQGWIELHDRGDTEGRTIRIRADLVTTIRPSSTDSGCMVHYGKDDRVAVRESEDKAWEMLKAACPPAVSNEALVLAAFVAIIKEDLGEAKLAEIDAKAAARLRGE